LLTVNVAGWKRVLAIPLRRRKPGRDLVAPATRRSSSLPPGSM
jgi:hypothetical protein